MQFQDSAIVYVLIVNDYFYTRCGRFNS